MKTDILMFIIPAPAGTQKMNLDHRSAEPTRRVQSVPTLPVFASKPQTEGDQLPVVNSNLAIVPIVSPRKNMAERWKRFVGVMRPMLSVVVIINETKLFMIVSRIARSMLSSWPVRKTSTILELKK
jgi:hypothetical protein